MANPMYGQNKFDNAIDNAKENIVVTVAATTLTAAQSGATVLHQVADAALTLPAAKAGLNFKIVLGIASTSGCNILTASNADCFFGVIPISSSGTDDQTGIAQILTHAVAIAAPASYDAMKFVAATATIGGLAGECIWLTAVDDTAWYVSIPYHATSHADPGDCALIVAR